MKFRNANELADEILSSKESIDATLTESKLFIRTEKNGLWILVNTVGIVFSLLFIASYNRGQYNLEIGLAGLLISGSSLWRLQLINKTLVFDAQLKTISIIPNFFIHKWILSKLVKINRAYFIDELQDLNIISYRKFKYHWTQRIYFKKGFWTIYLLEFDKRETAEKVLELLKA